MCQEVVHLFLYFTNLKLLFYHLDISYDKLMSNDILLCTSFQTVFLILNNRHSPLFLLKRLSYETNFDLYARYFQIMLAVYCHHQRRHTNHY